MALRFKTHQRSFFALFVATWLLAPNVWADTFKVLTTGAFKQVVVAVADDYQKRTGHKIDIQNDTAGAIAKRVAAGENFDVLVLPPSAMSAFAASGVVDKDSVVALAKVGIGVAVKEGAPTPPMATVEDFKRMLQNTRRVAIINPASGGSSGIYLEGLFQRMGLTDDMKAKAVLVNGGLWQKSSSLVKPMWRFTKSVKFCRSRARCWLDHCLRPFKTTPRTPLRCMPRAPSVKWRMRFCNRSVQRKAVSSCATKA